MASPRQLTLLALLAYQREENCVTEVTVKSTRNKAEARDPHVYSRHLRDPWSNNVAKAKLNNTAHMAISICSTLLI